MGRNGPSKGFKESMRRRAFVDGCIAPLEGRVGGMTEIIGAFPVSDHCLGPPDLAARFSEANELVTEHDRTARLLLPGVCLLFFLELVDEGGKAASPRVGEMNLLAEIQIVAQPPQVRCMGIIRNGVMSQVRHKLCLQCGRDVAHAEITSFRISFHSAWQTGRCTHCTEKSL